jgi:hypothetical protein
MGSLILKIESFTSNVTFLEPIIVDKKMIKNIHKYLNNIAKWHKLQRKGIITFKTIYK